MNTSEPVLTRNKGNAGSGQDAAYGGRPAFVPAGTGQRMALEVSEKSDTNITEKIAKEIRKAKMTEKDIREAIAGPDPEINKLTGEPIKPEEKP